jgi:hypothetical protein
LDHFKNGEFVILLNWDFSFRRQTIYKKTLFWKHYFVNRKSFSCISCWLSCQWKDIINITIFILFGRTETTSEIVFTKKYSTITVFNTEFSWNHIIRQLFSSFTNNYVYARRLHCCLCTQWQVRTNKCTIFTIFDSFLM